MGEENTAAGWGMLNFLLLIMFMCFFLCVRQLKDQKATEIFSELEEAVVLLDLAAVRACLEESREFAAWWRSPSGCTLLHICITHNYEPSKKDRVLSMCRLLVEDGGVDPNLGSWNSGWTPLHHACFFNLPDVAIFFLNQANCSSCAFATDLTTPAHLAAANGQVKVLKKLVRVAGTEALGFRNKQGLNPLCFAVEFSHLRAVDFLLRHGSTIPLAALETPQWKHPVLLRQMKESIDQAESTGRKKEVSGILSHIQNFPLDVELLVQSYMQINTAEEIKNLRGCSGASCPM